MRSTCETGSVERPRAASSAMPGAGRGDGGRAIPYTRPPAPL